MVESNPEKQILGTKTLSGYEGVMNYSFDYAQQIHVPYSPQQVGPIYFLTPYKVSLFGVACEPLTNMVIYIIPECLASGKGSNSVISYLHHFLETFSLGESEVFFRADNCTGQNKNRFTMSYLCFRVLTGLHKKITIAFLPVGHTKFFPDMGFGLFKRKFRVSEISTTADISKCVEDSSPGSHMLIPQLVGNENGETFVKVSNQKIIKVTIMKLFFIIIINKEKMVKCIVYFSILYYFCKKIQSTLRLVKIHVSTY